MCYSEFNDIIASIADMDADVITIETSRSDMELLDAFDTFKYPNEIGPGVYDIHSPNIPTQEHIVGLMKKAAERIPAERLGEPGLRPEDAPVGGGDSGADEHGHRREDAAQRGAITRAGAGRRARWSGGRPAA